MEIIWKAIPGYEGKYEVSNNGEIKSLAYGKERLLKPSINRGYKQVVLHKNGGKTKWVHQLVAITFLGYTPDGHNTVINHIDNNPSNNNVNNLEITSQRNNSMIHKTDAGVFWYKDRQKYVAQITIFYKHIHLGYFDTKEEGLDIYRKAVENIHLYNGDNKEFRNQLKQCH